ncbi:hypothetical protein AGLY_006161, partial [Aphis glycines]
TYHLYELSSKILKKLKITVYDLIKLAKNEYFNNNLSFFIILSSWKYTQHKFNIDYHLGSNSIADEIIDLNIMLKPSSRNQSLVSFLLPPKNSLSIPMLHSCNGDLHLISVSKFFIGNTFNCLRPLPSDFLIDCTVFVNTFKALFLRFVTKPFSCSSDRQKLKQKEYQISSDGGTEIRNVEKNKIKRKSNSQNMAIGKIYMIIYDILFLSTTKLLKT